MGIYEFVIWYEPEDIPAGLDQRRYVAAESEEEARMKLEAYNEKMHDAGYMKFEIGRCISILDEIIV